MAKRSHNEEEPVQMQVDSPVKAKKVKKETASVELSDEVILELMPIAKPLAGKKTGKHVLKLVKKSSKVRTLKRGVKEVVKSIRKGEKGIVVLAADISPMDILTHLPALAEESRCPYIWINSKEALGAASSTKRPTSCVMVTQAAKKTNKKKAEGSDELEKEFQESFAEVEKEVKELDETVVY